MCVGDFVFGLTLALCLTWGTVSKYSSKGLAETMIISFSPALASCRRKSDQRKPAADGWGEEKVHSCLKDPTLQAHRRGISAMSTEGGSPFQRVNRVKRIIRQNTLRRWKGQLNPWTASLRTLCPLHLFAALRIF